MQTSRVREILAQIPGDIRAGKASENPETSRAIELMILACAKSYAETKEFYASGTYIEATKRLSAGESKQAASMEICYKRPDLLRVVFKGGKFSGGFYADGQQITTTWPDEEKYQRIRQPKSLSTLSDEETTQGDMIEDQSYVVGRSLIASLLVSSDPIGWLHANVDEYYYDGVEAVSGVPCWKVRFIQSNPDMVVINWIAKQDGYLRKVSMIQAVDKQGNAIHSYEKAAAAQMRISLLDCLATTTTKSLCPSFRFEPPRGWTVKKSETKTTSEKGNESFWVRLYRAAATDTGQGTSVTLNSDFGGELLKASWSGRVPEKISALAANGSKLAVGTTGGKVTFVDFGGTSGSQVSLGFKPELLAVARNSSGSLIVAGNRRSSSVRAYQTSGKLAWTYGRSAPVTALLVDKAEGQAAGHDRIDVSYNGSVGFVELDTLGQVRYATRKVSSAASLAVGAWEGYGRVVACADSDEKITLFAPEGKAVKQFSSKDTVSRMVIDKQTSSAPLLTLESSDDEDLMLRRYSLQGELLWTVGVAQGLDTVDVVGFGVARLRLAKPDETSGTLSDEDTSTTATKAKTGQGELQSYAIVALSDGRVSLFSSDGDLVWRGSLEADSSSAVADKDTLCLAMTPADLNGDGADEIYVAADDLLMRLSPSK